MHWVQVQVQDRGRNRDEMRWEPSARARPMLIRSIFFLGCLSVLLFLSSFGSCCRRFNCRCHPRPRSTCTAASRLNATTLFVWAQNRKQTNLVNYFQRRTQIIDAVGGGSCSSQWKQPRGDGGDERGCAWREGPGAAQGNWHMWSTRATLLESLINLKDNVKTMARTRHRKGLH